MQPSRPLTPGAAPAAVLPLSPPHALPIRSGLLAGALLVEEAGGAITDIRSHPWTLTSEDVLATAPGLSAVTVLSAIL